MKRMITVTTENSSQFYAAIAEASPDLVYADAGWADPKAYRQLTDAAHAAGKRCGLRLPHIWREEAEGFFQKKTEAVREAGFDRYLFRNIEGVCFFEEHSLLEGVEYALDHSIYVTNRDAAAMTLELLPDGGKGLAGMTCPLELNALELRVLTADVRDIFEESFAASGPAGEGGTRTSEQVPEEKGMELVVYGRAPMMISAQCLKKTTGRCDGRPSVMVLEDRKGAGMPVINCCRFCCNTIYNAVPAVLYDLPEETEAVGACAYRYEFTDETADEVRKILAGTWKPSAFTRGHFKKSVL